MPTNQELEGTTFRVYLYVVREGKPVGPRDVMRGVNLSSPSVAYRHLRKLENLGLLQRTQHGEYVVKERANIKGHLWVGRSLVPRLLFYSFFFMGILIAEAVIIAIRFSVNEPLQMEFIFLTLVTMIAVVIFLIEGTLLFVSLKTG